MAPMVNDASDDILFLILETFTDIIMVHIYPSSIIYIILIHLKYIYILINYTLLLAINLFTFRLIQKLLLNMNQLLFQLLLMFGLKIVMVNNYKCYYSFTKI